MPRNYIATIQILVEADGDTDAADAVSSFLRPLTQNEEGALFDWQYVTLGEQLLSPTETQLNSFEE